MQINWTHSAPCMLYIDAVPNTGNLLKKAKERYIKDGPTDQGSPVTAHTARGSWLSGPGVTWGVWWPGLPNRNSSSWFSRISLPLTVMVTVIWSLFKVSICWPCCLKMKAHRGQFSDGWSCLALLRTSLALARPTPAPSHGLRPPNWVLTLTLAFFPFFKSERLTWKLQP